MRVFISGGCKNGKSYHAQRLAKHSAGSGRPLYYIATMKPVDSEDDERIARHRADRRGWGFVTIEQPQNIEEILKKCDTVGSFLLDSLTALLSNEMFTAGGEISENAAEKISGGLRQVIEQIPRIVIVSDYIYSDAIKYDPLTEAYRKSLAGLDRLAAGRCEVVLEAAYTQIIAHKGGGVFDALP
ncbi:MAG: bifunctional adenosylcobinamide kinase/adenosylcobinamide-phosphate guanylyltransferase [Oscillospiraceae bacterium]|nr:bifunctional adenosylcobinamide kinase/adenosylcobinamide-phosphate guanylyltransferase [Oscillospiraceae bacterium]